MGFNSSLPRLVWDLKALLLLLLLLFRYSLTPFGSLFQFMDLTSLQETLPDPHTPTDYSGSLTEPWISQNSTMSYIPSGPQGT